jgi:hypothetical protein
MERESSTLQVKSTSAALAMSFAESGGFMASSHDLNAGLDVDCLPLASLPHDVLNELLRMRRQAQQQRH